MPSPFSKENVKMSREEAHHMIYTGTAYTVRVI
jgi:hypothetical protein